MLTRKTAIINKENAISEMEKVHLGGIEQWITIRGEDRNLPILLFLHGGPGAAQIGFIGKFQRDLEKHFVVVNWDQRGAGLSYSKAVTREMMTIEQFVSDTIELTSYLLQQFGKKSLFLVGHSWGTILGLLAIHKNPELYHHYVGVSQVISMKKVEEFSYKLVVDKAIEMNDTKAVEQLKSIGKPPWKSLKHDRIHQKYVEKFGGGMSHDGKIMNTILKEVLKGKEYTLLDVVRFTKGQFFSMRSLIDEMRSLDLGEKIQNVDIPITFMMGRHDLTVPPVPTREFFDTLQTTKTKNWIWFENSAHSPLFEENQKFVEYVVSVAK